jgi:xanthine dehydrogenase molybdopterin-binding subunit B
MSGAHVGPSPAELADSFFAQHRRAVNALAQYLVVEGFAAPAVPDTIRSCR